MEPPRGWGTRAELQRSIGTPLSERKWLFQPAATAVRRVTVPETVKRLKDEEPSPSTKLSSFPLLPSS